MKCDGFRSENVTVNHCEVFIVNLKSIFLQSAQFLFLPDFSNPHKTLSYKLKPLAQVIIVAQLDYIKFPNLSLCFQVHQIKFTPHSFVSHFPKTSIKLCLSFWWPIRIFKPFRGIQGSASWPIGLLAVCKILCYNSDVGDFL